MYKRSRWSELLSIEADSYDLDRQSFLSFKKDTIRHEKILDYVLYRKRNCNFDKLQFWQNLELKCERYLKNYYRRLAGYAVYLSGKRG